MIDITNLIKQLQTEKAMKYKGGIYYLTQIELTYNSNRIEGSKLSKEHTRNLFETSSILTNKDEIVKKDDIIEATNHFRAFDYILDNYAKPLNEDMIKYIHFMLKQGTDDAFEDWFNVGAYKALANYIGEKPTTAPADVAKEMQSLLKRYQKETTKTIEDIIDFNVHFETIHPFQDGNGRVGRLIMFKECLQNNILPFIIDNEHKLFYYRGLAEYKREKGYLVDTCKSAQDKYELYCQQLVFQGEK